MVTVVGVGAGFAAGWGVARLAAPPPAPATPPVAAVVTNPAPLIPAKPAPEKPASADTLLRGLALETALRAALTEPDDTLRHERLRALAAQTDLAAYADALAKGDRILTSEDRSAYRLRLLELLVPQNPLAAVAAARTSPEAGQREWSLMAVLQAWARHDSTALVKWHLSLPDHERRGQLHALGGALGLYSPAAGLELGRGLLTVADRRIFYRSLFESWSDRDASGAYQAGSGILIANNQESELGQLIGRWALHDLPAAKAALAQLGAPDRHWTVFEAFFSGLVQERPAAAAELLAGISGFQRRRELVGQLMQSWANADAPAAKRWAEGLADAGQRQIALANLASALVDINPQAALELLPANGLGPDNTWVYRNLAAKLTGRDPKAALRLLESINPPTLRREVMLGLMDGWSATDPKAAATYATQLPAGPTREAALSSLIGGWANHDLKGTVDFVRGLDSKREQNSLLGQIMWQVGAQNPELGKELISSLPAGGARAGLVENFTSAWAKEDLNAAKTWIESLPEGAMRRDALAALPNIWAEQDPQGAANYALTMPDKQLQQQFTQAAIQQWVQSNPEAALQWAKALPGGQSREAALQTIAEFHAADDPRLATELALQMNDRDRQQGAVMSIVSNWSNSDPKAAAEWVAQFPAGELRDEAATQVVNAWAQHDPAATAQWLKDQPESPGRDNATEAFVTHLREEDPNTAGAWINSIADPARRTAALQEHVGWWWENNPKAAKAWLDSLGLPADLRDEWERAAESRAAHPDGSVFERLQQLENLRNSSP